MEEVGLIEAWGNWAQGEMNLEAQLWGMSILWWGRIGKLIGCLAALTIIAEIVGPERLRAFGDKLHGMIEPKRCLGFMATVWRWVNAWMAYSSDNKEEKAAAEAEMRASKVDKLFWWSIVLVFLGTWIGTITYAFGVPEGETEEFWALLIICLVVGFFLGGLAIALFVPAFAVSLCGVGLLLAVLDVLVIERTARLLERKQLDKLIKITSAVFLIIGFHFDLLAS